MDSNIIKEGKKIQAKPITNSKLVRVSLTYWHGYLINEIGDLLNGHSLITQTKVIAKLTLYGLLGLIR